MVHVLSQKRPDPLGQALGLGLESTVSSYLQKKQQIKEQEGFRKTGKAMGIPEEVLDGLADASPDVQKFGLTVLAKQQKEKQRLETLTKAGFIGAAPTTKEILPGQDVPGGPSLEPEKFTDEQIAALALHEPQLANVIMKQKNIRNRTLQQKAVRHSKVSGKVLERADVRAEALPQKEAALGSMIDAIENENLGFFSPDNLAEMTGIEVFRTPRGAQFVAAGKEFFLGSLKRAGARPNQWIEQQIQKMLPKIGRSRKANMFVAELLRTETETDSKSIELTRQIADEYEERLGYVPRQLGAEVQKQMSVIANRDQKLLEQRLRALLEDKPTKVKVEKGTPLTQELARAFLEKANGDKNKARKLAKRQGYEF